MQQEYEKYGLVVGTTAHGFRGHSQVMGKLGETTGFYSYGAIELENSPMVE